MLLAELRKLSLSDGLSETQLEELYNTVVVRKMRKGAIVYSTQNDDRKVFFVISGFIKMVEITEAGEEVIKDILSHNDVFGGSQELAAGSCEHAEVLSNKAIVVSISQNRFIQIMKANPTLSYNFNVNLMQKIQRLESRYATLARQDSKARLLSLLRGLASRREVVSKGRSLVLENYLTQEELAKMIFVSRQTFSRALKDLRKSGRLIYNRRRIEILGQ